MGKVGAKASLHGVSELQGHHGSELATKVTDHDVETKDHIKWLENEVNEQKENEAL